MLTSATIMDQDLLLYVNDYVLFGGVVGILLFATSVLLFARKKEKSPHEEPQKQGEALKEKAEEKESQTRVVESEESDFKADEEAPEKTTLEESSKETPEAQTPALKVEEKPPVQLQDALGKTRNSFLGRIKSVFSSEVDFSDEHMEELEEILYTSDLGPRTVERLTGKLNQSLKNQDKKNFESVREALKSEINSIFSSVDFTDPFEEWSKRAEKPLVIMIVGVNGAGKTTTIGKMARRFSQENKKVLIAAGDTFRAAASDQLKVWSERAEVEIFSPEGVSDPSAVAFDAYQAAKSKEFGVLIVDTAGRLHTQSNLMEELKKMKRVVAKGDETAPHEVLLVLDANSGQNALLQAKNFHEALNVSGVVLTKMDGTAKGGVAVGVVNELGVPIRLIGVGEGIQDLRAFSAQEFVDSIL